MTCDRTGAPTSGRRPPGAHSARPSAGRTGVAPTSWALWREAPRVLTYVLAVDALAVVLGAVLSAFQPVRREDLVLAGLLALGAAVHIEVARHMERPREIAPTVNGRLYIDLKSMFSFAGLLLLPLGPALALVVVTFAVWWVRVPQRPPAYRWVFSCAAVVLGSCAASVVIGAFGVREVLTGAGGLVGLAAVCLAALARWAVNGAAVIGAVSLSAPDVPLRTRVGTPTDHLLALGALALGVVVGVLTQASPWLIPVLLVPLVTMHRGFLIPQLVRATSVDTKTGAATAAHWHARGERELARAGRRGTGVGVLMVDLDEFKAVNDSHGHLVGDRALRAVAQALGQEVRAGDSVGRFGGEEFVVLLVDVDPVGVVATAERVRTCVAALEVPLSPGDDAPALTGLTVSVGAAHVPGSGATLDALVVAADSALYDAKRAGRNQVRRAARV